MAALRGIGGVVTDGACRDVDEARELKFPVFSRSPAVRTARARIHEQAVGSPIVVGGISVAPGDLVVADGSGVVIVAADQIAAVLDVAEGLALKEADMKKRLNDGVAVDEVLGASYEHLLRNARPL